MSFTFNSGIPAANNNPSVDQPVMQQNNLSTETLLAVDHITFNDANAGKHKQVTFQSKNTPGAQTDPQSVLYTGDGTASSVAQVYFRNQVGTFLMSALKAFGSFTATASGVVPTLINQYNIDVANITKVGLNYTFPLITNAVANDDVILIVNARSTLASVTYSFSAGAVLINSPSTSGVIYDFIVIQA